MGFPPTRLGCYTVLVPFMDADGNLIDPTSCDTEVSKDGGAFADATNEVAVLSNGIGYITFDSTEMQCSVLVAVFKSANAKPTPMVIYPGQQVKLADGTAQAGDASSITLASDASSVDDYYNGALIRTSSGTGGGAGAKQVRRISDYNGTTKVATIGPNNWEVNPSSDTGYVISITPERPWIPMDAIADKVWDEARAGHTTAGSFGEGQASVQGNVTGSVGSVTGNVGGNVVGTVGSVVTKTGYELTAAYDAAKTAAQASTALSNVIWTDARAGKLDNLDAAISTRGTADTGDAMTLANGAITAAVIATDAIDADAIKADAITEIQSGLALAGEAATAVGTLNDLSSGDVETAVGTALGTYDPPTKAELDSAVSPLATSAEIAALNDPTAADVADAVWNEATADHQTAGSAGKALTDAGAAGDPWSTAVPGEYEAGTAGAILGTNLNATVSSRSTLTAQQVWEYGTRTLSSFGTLVADIATGVWGAVARTITGGTVTTVSDKTDYALSAAGVSAVQSGLAATGEAATAVGALVIPSAADNADAVWDEAVADHTEAGSTGNALTAAGSAGDPWSTTLPGAYGDNTAGKIVGTNLDTTVSSRSTLTAAQVWANGTRTLSSFGTLVADVAAGVWGAVARTITGGTVTTNSDKSGYSLAADQAVNVTKVAGSVVSGVDDFKANVSGLATSAEITALNDLSAAQVQTAVGTALGTYDVPTKTELDSAVSPLATANALTTVSGKVDTVDGIVDAIKLKTDNLPASPAAVGSAMTLSVAERSAVAAALLATNITYPDGSTKTVEELLEEVWATTAGDTSITELVQQFLWPDNATVAFSFEIDDADAPTSRTRQ